MLKQEGTVWEYIRDFIALASNAPKVTDTVLEMAFTIGLKPQIKAGIKLMAQKSEEDDERSEAGGGVG